MGCVRAPLCPLFPHLNASLRGWREAYCDSDDGARRCERYRRFLAGQPVPLGLLPNGKIAAAVNDDAAPEAGAQAPGTQAPGTQAPGTQAPGDAHLPYDDTRHRPRKAWWRKAWWRRALVPARHGRRRGATRRG